VTGSEFCALLEQHLRLDRGRLVLEAQESWMAWPFAEVELGPEASCFVTTDYFAIGTDADHVRVPLDAPTAQRVADRLGMLMPTSRIVDAIWAAASVRLTPAPRSTVGMLEVGAFVDHDATVQGQLAGRSGLLAGHKKDVVVGERARAHPGRVCIYGWHRLDGRAIQPLSTIHEDTYADYSHGVRLVDPVMRLRGRPVSIDEVAAGAEHALVSSEGPLGPAALRYGPMATPAPACQQALRDASARWPSRSRASDGIMGDARHQAGVSDHNLGDAVDITHDPASGCTGDVIAAAALDDPRTNYIIWAKQINSLDGRGWRPYAGSNPHARHCHISIKSAARTDVSRWGWAPDVAPVYPGTVLRMGLSGQHVRAAQERLVLAGASITADGAFGPLTRAAVVAFQARTGLEADGRVGPATWARLWA
jgi:hypothetical protein